MHRNEQALDAYQKLLKLIEADVQANPMHWVACNVKLAEIYQRMEDLENCRLHCDKVLNRKFSEDELTKPGKKRLKKAEELLQSCD
jgi:hypothetical protein